MSIAVVVQQLVPADAAGVMVTEDLVSGSRDEIFIRSNWGRGQSVVAGEVTPDVAIINAATGELASYRIGTKAAMTVPAGNATRTADTPAGQRAAAVLPPGQAGELGRVGLAIEELYGEPVDVEWALAGNELFVVQARPITARGGTGGLAAQAGDSGAVPGGAGPDEEWNDSLGGDYLWSNGNLGEAIPDVMTPATWSAVQLLMSAMLIPPSVPGYRAYGRIGGRFYANVSLTISLEALIGWSPKRGSSR